MYFPEIHAHSHWWIVPVILMLFCFLAMRRRRGMTMCGFCCRWMDRRKKTYDPSDLEDVDDYDRYGGRSADDIDREIQALK